MRNGIDVIRRPNVTLLLLALALTAGVATYVEPFDPDANCCDHLFYRSMAYNLFVVTRPELNEWPATLPDPARLYNDPYHGAYLRAENKFNRQPPYVFRVLTPLTARALAWPLDDDINRAFWIVTFAALTAACYWISRCAYLLSGDLLLAVATALSFTAIYRMSEYHLTKYMLVDPLSFACIALGIYLLLTRRDGWFVLLSAIAIFNKEHFALMMATAVLYQLHERRLTPRIIGGYAAIAVTYLLFRLTVPIPERVAFFGTVYHGLPQVKPVANSVITVFGVLALFVATRIWIARWTLWLLTIAAGALLVFLITSDLDRVVMYAFPLVLLSIFGVRVRGRLPRLLAAAPAAAFVAFTIAQRQLPGVSYDIWHRLYGVTFVAIEVPFLLLVTRRGEQLARRIPGNGRLRRLLVE